MGINQQVWRLSEGTVCLKHSQPIWITVQYPLIYLWMNLFIFHVFTPPSIHHFSLSLHSSTDAVELAIAPFSLISHSPATSSMCVREREAWQWCRLARLIPVSTSLPPKPNYNPVLLIPLQGSILGNSNIHRQPAFHSSAHSSPPINALSYMFRDAAIPESHSTQQRDPPTQAVSCAWFPWAVAAPSQSQASSHIAYFNTGFPVRRHVYDSYSFWSVIKKTHGCMYISTPTPVRKEKQTLKQLTAEGKKSSVKKKRLYSRLALSWQAGCLDPMEHFPQHGL